jgi:ADP-ribose pyrophosphatase YjhB (NUDIX family)
MAKYLYGDRIGATATLSVGSSAIIWDEPHEKVFLTQRTDNGRWCLPSGALDAGESVEEGCRREVLEETGLIVKIDRLIAIYSTPHRIITYADGNRYQMISFSFEATIIGGEARLSDETTAFGYFSLEEIRTMDVMEPHVERIEDALLDNSTTLIK